MYEKEKAMTKAAADEYNSKRSESSTGDKVRKGAGLVLGTLGGAVGGTIAGRTGSMALAKLLSKKNPDLLKKLVGYRHNQAKANLKLARSVSGGAGGGAGAGLAYKAVKDED